MMMVFPPFCVIVKYLQPLIVGLTSFCIYLLLLPLSLTCHQAPTTRSEFPHVLDFMKQHLSECHSNECTAEKRRKIPYKSLIITALYMNISMACLSTLSGQHLDVCLSLETTMYNCLTIYHPSSIIHFCFLLCCEHYNLKAWL